MARSFARLWWWIGFGILVAFLNVLSARWLPGYGKTAQSLVVMFVPLAMAVTWVLGYIKLEELIAFIMSFFMVITIVFPGKEGWGEGFSPKPTPRPTVSQLSTPDNMCRAFVFYRHTQ